jgi:hypothetical protein
MLGGLLGGEPVSIDSPAEGATVSGALVISGTSQLTTGQVRISIDGGPFVLAQGLASWSFGWNTTLVSDGAHTITARAKSDPQAEPDFDTISVAVSNAGAGVLVAIDAPVDADVIWGQVTVSGTSTGATSVSVQIDDGPFLPALGTGSWSFTFNASALTQSDHSISVRASVGAGAFSTDSVEVIANPQSPPLPDCGELQPGTPLPYENPIAPAFVDLAGPTTVHLEIIGHSENSGYGDDLQALLDAAPPGGHQYVVTNHWIGGQELWRWVTPGEAGFEAIEALLANIQGPTFALILVSNNTTFPILDPSFADLNYGRFVDECGQLADHLHSGGQGVQRSWFSAHRMKPQNLMPCWHENLVFADVMADAATSGRDHVKPGPAQHDLHWCCYPDCYSTDLSHPGPEGDALMAEAWYQLLLTEFGGDVAWSDQGSALAGVTGQPSLVGSGALSPLSSNSVDLSNAAPSALAGLFIALSSTPVPFKGGTLIPFPFLTPVFLATSAAGMINIPFLMPAGVPVGTQLWAQWAIQDAVAINGVALSNAIKGVTS